VAGKNASKATMNNKKARRITDFRSIASGEVAVFEWLGISAMTQAHLTEENKGNEDFLSFFVPFVPFCSGFIRVNPGLGWSVFFATSSFSWCLALKALY
jgi:hypothetical protein